MKFCEKCGREVTEEKFCSSCGNEIKSISAGEELNNEDKMPNNNLNEFKENIEKNSFNISRLPKKALVIAGTAVVAIIIVIVALSNTGPNFKKIFNKYCEPVWAELGSDNSYLYIDTNPYDEEDEGLAFYEAYTAIEKINKELGLPDSLFDAMGRTTGNDGKQSEEFNAVEISWRYHPDKGLEVSYKKK